MRQSDSEKGEVPRVSGLGDHGEERDRNLLRDGTSSGASQVRFSGERALPESIAPRVPNSWPEISLSEHAVAEVDSFGAVGERLSGVCFDFGVVRRHHFVVSSCIASLHFVLFPIY